MADLHTLCTRDLSVCYLPGHQPDHGHCPVKHCQSYLEQLPKRERNRHVQACTRQEIASEHEYSLTDVHYCHLCLNWIVGPAEWKNHCQTHLDDLDSKRCGTITYCHTLVRPAYCPFCLGNTSKSARQRLESWCRDHALWQHVDKHLQGRRWPVSCPHPLCNVFLRDGLDLCFYFIDEHGLSRTVPEDTKNLGTTGSCPEEGQMPLTKRKVPEDGFDLSWSSSEQFSPIRPPKKVKRDSPTIVPPLLSNIDADTLCPTSPIDLTGSDSSIYAPEKTPPIQIKEDRWSENCLKSGTQSPVRFGSCESTVVNDDIFSQFIRSPSPDDIPTTLTADQDRQAVVDMDDLIPPSTISFSEASLSHHDSKPNCPLDVPLETRPKLRIRLRVEPPKTKIKSRVSAPQKSESDKRLCLPKKCKGTRRQRPQKKTAAQRR